MSQLSSFLPMMTILICSTSVQKQSSVGLTQLVRFTLRLLVHGCSYLYSVSNYHITKLSICTQSHDVITPIIVGPYSFTWFYTSEKHQDCLTTCAQIRTDGCEHHLSETRQKVWQNQLWDCFKLYYSN